MNAGNRLTWMLARAILSDLGRNGRAVHAHVLAGLSRARVHAVAFGLFVAGGEDQRRMVAWVREHGGMP